MAAQQQHARRREVHAHRQHPAVEVTVDDPDTLLEPFKMDPRVIRLNPDPKATFIEDLPCEERDAAQSSRTSAADAASKTSHITAPRHVDVEGGGTRMRLRLYGLIIACLCGALPPSLTMHYRRSSIPPSALSLPAYSPLCADQPACRWFFDVKKPDGTIDKWEVSAAGAGPIRQAASRALQGGGHHKVTQRRHVMARSRTRGRLQIS